MRVLYIYQYFKSRDGHGSTRAYEFIRRLQDAGHDVLVLTSTAKLPDLVGRRTRGLIEGQLDGIRVWGVPSHYSNRMSLARRAIEFVRFATLSTLAVLRAPRPDLLFASSTPLTVAVPALAGSHFRGLPLVFEARDLWPEVPIGMGLLRNRLLIAAARWLAGLAYRRSEAVIALSPGMREGILRYGIAPEKVTVIPNGSDLDLFRPGEDKQAARRRIGIPEEAFILIHPGAMGIVNGLEFLLPVCARLMIRAPEAVVILLGEGGRRAALERSALEKGLDNLRFVDPVPKNRMPDWLAAADVGLMLIRQIAVLEMNSANKFFDYAAAGLPCLMNYGGWKAEMLERYGAGVACRTDDPDLFADAIAAMAEKREDLAAMGRNARRMAETEFDREKQFASFREILERAGGAGGGGRGAAPASPGRGAP